MSDQKWVDFRVVKEHVSMQMVLDHYNIDWLRKSGSEFRGKCPIHNGEGDRTFHANLDKNAFNCFSCHKRGNVLDFVAAMESCTVRDAAIKLSEWFSLDPAAAGEPTPQKSTAAPARDQIKGNLGNRPKSKAPKTGPINPPLSFQLRIDCSHDYGLSRGVARETLELFGAGLCLSKGTFAGRFVIPLHDDRGQLVGYAGRSLDGGEPEYLFPSSDKGFYKSHLLFNLHRIINTVGSGVPVVVVEGFFDTMKVVQAEFPCVGLLGSWLSEEQANLLVTYFTHVILMFDGNAAGRQGAADALDRLARRLFVKVVSLPDEVEPDGLSADEVRQLLTVR
jgi:DNA primase